MLLSLVRRPAGGIRYKKIKKSLIETEIILKWTHECRLGDSNMGKTGLIGLAAGWMLIAAGCSFTLGGGHADRWEGVPPAERAMLAEIDAAAAMPLEHDRRAGLERLAAADELPPRAQARLAEAALDRLKLEQSRKSAILALIHHPDLVLETKMRILQHLDALLLDSSRREVMDAINRRGRVPAAGDIESRGEPSADEPRIRMQTTLEMAYSTRF
jgi:hypothetical protein